MKKSLNKRFAGFNGLFWLTVVVPTALSSVYFGYMASDVYTSESSFVVRSPERQAPTSLTSLLKGSGFSRAQDDSFTVHEFVQSRDALKVLNAEIDLDKAYASPDVDVLNRFAALDGDNSFEALHRYYQKKITVLTDSNSSISVLKVKAFRPEDAQRANEILLKQSESLVNRMNERGRQDLIRYAQQEVLLAQDKVKATGIALAGYRDRQGVIDPERQATAQLTQVTKMQDELMAVTTQLAQLRASTPNNPQIPSLVNLVKTLQAQITKEIATVTGAKSSLSNKATEFHRLALDADFANKQLASALASLESARSEAQRQQAYLERISQPNLPDVAQEPRRLRSILATLLMGLVAWGVLSMLIAGVKEHQN